LEEITIKWQAKDFFLKTHVEFFDQSFGRMMKCQAEEINPCV
jgi:hypothetical protein